MSNESIIDHFEDWEYLGERRNEVPFSTNLIPLRIESVKKSEEDLKAAEKEDRPILIGEWKAGIRRERLEWEAREAITSLWKKGYTTRSSGYNGFSGDHELSFVSLEAPPEEMLKKIWQLTDETGLLTYSYGALLLENDPKNRKYYSECHLWENAPKVYIWDIAFCFRGKNPQVIKQHWDRVADIMPDLDWEQLTFKTESADKFRNTHKLET